MIVVSDASPLNILLLLGEVELLPKLFGEISIPPAVVCELSHVGTPRAVSHWMANCPGWLKVRAPSAVGPSLAGMGAGESEAFSLALELNADLLLVDDRKARRVAVAGGLTITGTLGVLQAASIRGQLQLSEAIQRLRETNFRIADELLDQALREEAERHKRV